MRVAAFLFLFSSCAFALSISNSRILIIDIPPLPGLLAEVSKKHAEAGFADIVSVIHPAISIAPRLALSNVEFDPSPNLSFHIGFDLSRMFSVASSRKDDIDRDREKVLRTYGDICRNISTGRTVCHRIETYVELRSNTVDFEKRMTYTDKIFELDKLLLDLYAQAVSQQLSLYSAAGVAVVLDKEPFCYDSIFLRTVFLTRAGRNTAGSFVSSE